MQIRDEFFVTRRGLDLKCKKISHFKAGKERSVNYDVSFRFLKVTSDKVKSSDNRTRFRNGLTTLFGMRREKEKSCALV
jgi:hypothetical protein